MTVEWQPFLGHLAVLAIVGFVALWIMRWASRPEARHDERDYRRSVLPFDADEGD